MHVSPVKSHLKRKLIVYSIVFVSICSYLVHANQYLNRVRLSRNQPLITNAFNTCCLPYLNYRAICLPTTILDFTLASKSFPANLVPLFWQSILPTPFFDARRGCILAFGISNKLNILLMFPGGFWSIILNNSNVSLEEHAWHGATVAPYTILHLNFQLIALICFHMLQLEVW